MSSNLFSGSGAAPATIAPALLQTKDGRKNRLIITHIECENFKSYANTQTIGPFHKCFSSIVGPNGSGKSNVIDALLFVFGKRAMQLRLKKISELIHKSAQYPNLTFARVSVFFQVISDDENSPDGYEVVEGSQFRISRFALADGGSNYYIDDKKSSYTEVGELLRSYQIDLDNNRFLILQGEVEQIAMMKPKGATPGEDGLLEYLEDIIGSNVFLQPIEQAGKKLEEINEQRVDKVQRLKTADRERNNLTDSKIEVEEYLQAENDLREKKNLVFQYNLSTNREKFAQNREKIESLNEKLSAKKQEMKEMEEQVRVMQKDYDAKKKAHSTLEKELATSTSQYDALERKEVKLSEDLKHCRSNVKKSQTSLLRDQKKLEEIAPELDSLKIQIGKYRQTLQDFEKSRDDAQEEMNALMASLEDETKDLRDQLEKEKIALAEAEKSVASLQTEKDLAENAIELIETRPQAAIKNLQTSKEKLAQLLEERQANEQQLQEIARSEDSGLLKKSKALDQEVARLEKKEAELSEMVRSLMVKIELQKAALQSQESVKNGNKVVSALLQASKNRGPLSGAGIRGRLGDLASIPAEYDVAVTTAAGQLDFIVVDTIEGGQLCIDYLRKMNIGRASFIILQQIQEEWTQRMSRSQARSYPEPRLFDLLQDFASEDLRCAFYFVLRDTLVAADLDRASAVAYEGDRAKYRVVTLSGEMIELSGAMSGGGKELRRGGMRLATATSKTSKGSKKGTVTDSNDGLEEEVSTEIIARNEAKLSDLQQQLSGVVSQKSEKERERKTLDQEVKQRTAQKEQLTLSLQRHDEVEPGLRQRIAKLEAEKELTAGERKAIAQKQKELEQIEAAMSTTAPELKTLQNRVSILQRDILAVGGMRMTKLQAKVDSYNQQMEMVSKAISTKAADEANLLKTTEKLSASISKSTQDLQKQEARLSQLEQEKDDMERDVKTITAAIEATKEQLLSMEVELKKMATVYNELKESSSKFKALEVDLLMEVEKLQQEQKEIESQVSYWEKELKSLRETHSSEVRELMTSISDIYLQHNLPLTDMKSVFSVRPSSSSSIEEQSEVMEVEEGDNWSPFGCLELPVFSVEQLASQSVEDAEEEINDLEEKKNKLKSSVNMNALIDYFKKEVNYRLKLKDLEAIDEQRAVIRKEYDHFRKQRLEMFLTGFGQISLKLKEMYQLITLGGDAELELIDSLDPFSEGIAFSVRPPKKSWKQISNLSGGEKTLSSLALVFALHYYKPTPLYVMDEIDAALDFKNVSIVANYIKERTKDAQFIIISLRNNMFELADRLIGIYKTSDTTKSVTINPKKFAIEGHRDENEENRAINNLNP